MKIPPQLQMAGQGQSGGVTAAPARSRKGLGAEGASAAAGGVQVALASLAVVVIISLSGTVPTGAATLAIAAVSLAAAMVVAGFGRQSLFTALTGVALTSGYVATVGSGPSLSRWVALATLPTVPALGGLATLRTNRFAISLLAAGGILAGPVRALVYDPFLDPACSDCHALPVVVRMQSAAAPLALVGGAAVVVGLGLAVWRDASARPPALAVLAVSGWAVTGWSTPRGTVPAAAQVAAFVVVVTSGWVLGRIARTRAQLHRLAEALESGTGPRDALRRALRDPSLVVDFASGHGSWVDVDGVESPGPGTGPVTTPVCVGDAVAVRVHHRPDAGQAARLAATLSTEMRLVVEHAALTAQLQAQVRLLRESRLRLVEAADYTRRQLERDLHDGAQQALLALGFDVRSALAADPDDPRLPQCVAEVSAALDDLRRLASGVHPALLTDAGLGPALESLGTSVPHPVRIGRLPQVRFTAALERTVYLLVVDLATDGAVDLDGSVTDGWLRLVVRGRALPAGSVVRERIDAIGGLLLEEPGTVEVRMPCK